MDYMDREVRPKLGLLRLAAKLGSVTKACETLGYSRDSYYRFKALYERGGVHALHDISRRKPLVKNQLPRTVERAVLEKTFAFPSWGQQRVARALTREGVAVSSSGIRSIWVRSGLETFEKRVFALLAKRQQDGFPFSPAQQAAVDRARAQGKLRSSRYLAGPGEVCYQDMIALGDHPHLGPLYLAFFIEAYSRYAFADITDDPHMLHPVEFLERSVFPWFRARRVPVLTIRTDRRPPFLDDSALGYPAHLQERTVGHIFRLKKAAAETDPGTSFAAMVKREVIQPFFRRDGAVTLTLLRAELSQWLLRYNEKLAYGGPYCFGKTPLKTFADATRFGCRASGPKPPSETSADASERPDKRVRRPEARRPRPVE